jgi:hypothetical protein
MTKRLFFSCPIKALFMQKYFGVKLEPFRIFGGEAHIFDINEDGIKPEVNFLSPFDKVYVEPESFPIFENRTKSNLEFFDAEIEVAE